MHAPTCEHILHTLPVAQQTYSFTPKWRTLRQSQCEWPKANKIPLWLKCYHVHVRIQNKYKKPPGPNCFKNSGPLLLWSPKPETSTRDWTRSPEEQQHRLGKGLEIVVSVDLVVISHGHFPEHLEREIIRGKRKNFIIWRKKKKKKPSTCEFRTQVQSIPKMPGTWFIPLRCAGLSSNHWAHPQLGKFLPWGRDAEITRQAALPMGVRLVQPHRKHRTGSGDPWGWGLAPGKACRRSEDKDWTEG